MDCRTPNSVARARPGMHGAKWLVKEAHMWLHVPDQEKRFEYQI